MSQNPQIPRAQPRAPIYKGTIYPTLPKPRTKEAFTANYPFPLSQGYYLSVKAVIKSATFQYPEPACMIGFNASGKSVFAMFKDPIELANLGKWFIKQAAEMKPILEAENRTAETLKKQIDSTQQLLQAQRYLQSLNVNQETGEMQEPEPPIEDMEEGQ